MAAHKTFGDLQVGKCYHLVLAEEILRAQVVEETEGVIYLKVFTPSLKIREHTRLFRKTDTIPEFIEEIGLGQ